MTRTATSGPRRRGGRDRSTTALPALVLVLLLALAPAAGAAPAPDGADGLPVAWEQIPVAGLTRTGAADPAARLTARFGLRGTDEAGLLAAAAAASSPTSPAQGAFLDLAEVDARFGAPPGDRDLLVEALAARGITGTVGPTGLDVAAPMTVAQAEDLFSTTWGRYVSREDGPVALPDEAPSLPAGLVGVVDLVTGLVPDPPATLRARAAAPPGGGTPTRTGTAEACPEALRAPGLAEPGTGRAFGLFPNQLATAYGLTPLRDLGIDGTGVRAAIVGAAAPSPTDLDAFSRCLGLDPSAVRIDAEPGTEAGPPTTITQIEEAIEAALDVQVLLAAAPGLDRLDVYSRAMGGSPEAILTMVEAPLVAARAGRPLPHLVSLSYVACEAALAGDPVADLVEPLLAGAALAGVGYQVASGDDGSTCRGATGPSASYPASSAWVTAVGGTNLTLDAGNRIVGQGVWDDSEYPGPFPPQVGPGGAGAGAASTLVGRPAHQHGAGLPAGTTRLVPDVALFAAAMPGHVISCGTPCGGSEGPGSWTAVGGTSAATPLATGALALVTQAVTEARRASATVRLGLVAPTFWDLGRKGSDALRDVTVGSNDTSGVGCCTAGPGYDLASGWGSFDAARLAAALAPPSPPPASTPSGAAAPPARPVRAAARFTG